jgi:hypothetical protein
MSGSSSEPVSKAARNPSPHAEEGPKDPSRSTRAPREPSGPSFETRPVGAPQDEVQAFETGSQPLNENSRTVAAACRVATTLTFPCARTAASASTMRGPH